MHSYVLYRIPPTKLWCTLSIASRAQGRWDVYIVYTSIVWTTKMQRATPPATEKLLIFQSWQFALNSLNNIFEVRYQYKTIYIADCIWYLFISVFGEENIGFENTNFFLPNEAHNFFKHPKITSIWFYRGLQRVFNHQRKTNVKCKPHLFQPYRIPFSNMHLLCN